MKESLGLDVRLIEDKGGVFDVVVKDQLVYSKHDTGKFPDEEMLVNQLRSS